MKGGRVEVLVMDIWGTVGSRGWRLRKSEAQVICQKLGFNDTEAFALAVSSGKHYQC